MPENPPCLWTDATGVSDLYGLYAGFELAGTYGLLGPWSEGEVEPEFDWYTDLQPTTQVSDIEYSGPSDGTRFFDTNVSTIDPQTRSWLRELCLEHLHLLRDRTGSLGVVGHADPEGESGYNLGLSLDRARSAYEVFADVLGPHLHIPEERTFIGGRGEWESLGEEHPNTFSGDRRVDLYLAGERVIAVRPPEQEGE